MGILASESKKQTLYTKTDILKVTIAINLGIQVKAYRQFPLFLTSWSCSLTCVSNGYYCILRVYTIQWYTIWIEIFHA